MNMFLSIFSVAVLCSIAFLMDRKFLPLFLEKRKKKNRQQAELAAREIRGIVAYSCPNISKAITILLNYCDQQKVPLNAFGFESEVQLKYTARETVSRFSFDAAKVWDEVSTKLSQRSPRQTTRQ